MKIIYNKFEYIMHYVIKCKADEIVNNVNYVKRTVNSKNSILNYWLSYPI
ncbi:hypothetical protein PIROE2DRAFT_10668 [Piromyces sp. E2]|nr:hypothetical protein PIROE2DRAFT_10668 [Piromyces sp. E2]|eukprot:OUM62918.1 hypothetical protein PIROE2DRAFT_10668 [Piromyces sp. E2]